MMDFDDFINEQTRTIMTKKNENNDKEYNHKPWQIITMNLRWGVETDMNKNAPLSLDKLYFAGKFGQTLVYFVSHFVGLDWCFGAIWIHISRNWYLIQKDLNDREKIKREVWSSEIAKSKFRKGVGSGDAVERSCGWEEEMREELRKDWWGGKIFRIFVCICMFSCICICIWAVQGLVQRRTNIQLLICIQTQVGGLGKWVAGHLSYMVGEHLFSITTWDRL